MDFGVVLQTNPPASRTVELARLAETHGFSHVWTFDSHLLWQEPFVIYSAILAATRKVMVGPMVTNPATRDWTVIASLFATLNEMYGNRTICGIGRGDSAVRTLHGQAVEPGDAARVGARHPRAGQRPGRRGQRREGALPVVARVGPRHLGRRVRAAGAQADRRGGRRVHPAARRPRHRGVDHQGGARRRRAGRPGPRRGEVLRRRPDVHRGRPSRTCASSAAGSAGWSATTSPTSSPGTAPTRPCRRRSPTTSPAARATTTTSTAAPGTRTPRSCRTRSSSGSASSARAAEHVERLEALRDLGVTQFAGYLQHDNKEETMRVYGEHVIPALATPVVATA